MELTTQRIKFITQLMSYMRPEGGAGQQWFEDRYIDTIPNQVTYGMTINMVMNPERCHYDLPADWDPFYYIKIGDTMTDWEGLTDSSTRLSTW